MMDQWKWMDRQGKVMGVLSGFTAFVPGKPDKLVYSLFYFSIFRSLFYTGFSILPY